MKENKQRKNLDKALGQFIESLRLYIPAMLKDEYGEQWDVEYYESLSDKQQENWQHQIDAGKSPVQLIDFHNLGGVAIRQKRIFKKYFQREANNLPTIFNQIADARHMVAHYDEWDSDKASLAFAQMVNFASKMQQEDLVQELKSLQENKKVVAQIEEDIQTTQDVDLNEPAKAWFNNVKPHLDIRQGNLDESVFAADLAEVALGTGPTVYQNVTLFFEKTFFTAGLTNIANRVLAGLNGNTEGENRVISLQTGFGGGKTHTLISLYHLAKAGKGISQDEEVSSRLAVQPSFESSNIAAFTNTTNDPAQGRTTQDGIHIRTLWGELAYQLGGASLYEQIKENDQLRTAPKGLFKKILQQAAPCLILIDELADYCVAASGIQVGGSTLSDQTISFMQELTQAIAGVQNCVGVITLPASVGEVANSQQAESILMSLKDRVARVGADTKPVADEEIFEVIRRRLFEGLGDEKQIANVLQRYGQLYQENWTELPSVAKSNEYGDMMQRAYPFHPELINILRNKWASNPKFQRTRGVLRLLASVVSDLWKRRHNLSGNHFLIHSSHLEISNLDTFSGEIKKLYGNGYDAVVTSDISGISSNAYQIDQDKPSYGEHQIAQGISTVVYLNSFGSEGVNRGISTKQLKLHMIMPNSFNHNIINGALDELQSRAYYLYYTQKAGSDQRYWYHTKPNLNILVNKMVNDIKLDRVESEIINLLENAKSSIRNFAVIINPETDIPEQYHPTIVILHPSIYKNGNGIFEKKIKAIASKKGNSDRIYRNTILFLSVSNQSKQELYGTVREYLACLRVKEEYATQLEGDQKKELQQRINDARSKINKDLTVAYNQISKYSASQDVSTLEMRDFAYDFPTQLSSKVYNKLIEEEWLLESVGYNALLRNNLVPEDGNPIMAKAVFDAFRRYDDKYMITGSDAVKESLSKYCYNGQFAIGAKKGDSWSRVFYKETLPYFDVEDESYWLLTTGDYEEWAATEKQDSVPNNSNSGGELSPVTDSGTTGLAGGSVSEPSTSEVVEHLIITGKTDIKGFNQLFSSFFNLLQKNNVQVKFEITAENNANNPLIKSSQLYKNILESCRQLGYNLEQE